MEKKESPAMTTTNMATKTSLTKAKARPTGRQRDETRENKDTKREKDANNNDKDMGWMDNGKATACLPLTGQDAQIPPQKVASHAKRIPRRQTLAG
jgi:hypothetical protein